MLDKTVISPRLLLLILALVGTGCSDLDCPKGYTLKGDKCYRNKDGGADDGGQPGPDATGDAIDPITGSVPGDDAGDAGSMDSDTPEPPDEYALAEEGSSCATAQEQMLACEGHASSKALKCDQGTWKLAQTCGTDERCDSRVGTEQGKCAAIPAACLNKQPGDACDGTVRVTCGVDLVTVTPNACPSHAHCDAAGSARCACDVGWPANARGTCTNDDDCPADACAGGTCVDGLDDYSCDCPEGYAGTGTKQCTKVDYCPKNACTPGGTCIDKPDWSCQCNAGFSGTGTKACTNVDDCTAGACNPLGGTCKDGVEDYSCQCSTGFSGDSCENDICSPNPCRNGGTCSRTGTLCSCAPGFSGANCQLDACTPSPCQHGGTCTRTNQGATCECKGTGYEGTMCQTEVNECALPNSCTHAAYPCAQTEGIGYTCQGQYADWPMPDEVPGSKAKPSYSASGFVVTDNVTGLAWQQHVGPTYQGCTGNRMLLGDTCTWEEAKNYCAGFGSERDLWRLPSKIELESLIDDTAGNPSIDPDAFPNAPSDVFWTGSPVMDASARAYIVSFSNGTSTAFPQSSTLKVRCVRTARRAAAVAGPRYVINTSMSPASVTDTRTGLIWEREPDATPRDLAGAKSYCRSRSGSGWRLPTKKELLTLMNPMVPPTSEAVAIDLNAFPGTPWGDRYWTSTSSAAAGNSWVVIVTGPSDVDADTELRRVRCVH